MAMSNASPRIVRLLGHPVAHSLSPALHGAAFTALGINAEYHLVDVPPDDLVTAVAALRAPLVLGANVTVPHKEAVLPLLDEVAPLAVRVGAVNTIVRQGERLRGENTDVEGFLAPLHAAGAPFERWAVVLLGAGGAARAVASGLLAVGVPRLTIVNRTLSRAQTLACRLDDARVSTLALDEPRVGEVLAGASLLVDATAVGWHSAVPVLTPDRLDRLPARALVYDLTYHPTPLLRAAAARGLTTIDGLPMLVEQGALAFERWTGRDAPRSVMWSAALAARDARQRG